MLSRRSFLESLGALGAFTVLSARTGIASTQSSAPVQAQLVLGSSEPGSIVPADFVGLSYESAQLANPAFFSPRNTQLISLFRELSSQGNLRLGGGSSEFTTFAEKAPEGPPPFEVFGPDTSKTVKSGTTTSTLALRNLREFLDAVNWSCLYGLNLGQGSVENAVREASAAFGILGPRLLAFQIGNEPDSFRKRYRPETFTPADYLREWNQFREAIQKAVPEARFVGPDISNKLPYLSAFAAEAPQHPEVILLTSHYYAMGPASNPEATLDNLLDPDPKLTTLKRRDLHVITEARETARLPYRMSEGNSCWDGGKQGISDTFASALWCADYMLQAAARGWAGVNLHGGGNGFYTPIAGAPSTGLQRRPEFFGMRFAQHFVGARPVEAALHDAGARVAAYVFSRGSRPSEIGDELALINKTPEAVACTLPSGVTAAETLTLRAPAIDAKEGVTLLHAHGRDAKQAIVPAYAATVFRLKGVLPLSK